MVRWENAFFETIQDESILETEIQIIAQEALSL